MKIITDLEFANFLTDLPLYYKLKAVENFKSKIDTFSSPQDFKDKAFKFNCPNENEIQTFRTELIDYGIFGRIIYTEEDENRLPINFDEKTRLLNLTIAITGKCQSCSHKINFFIRAYSDRVWEERNQGINIYLQKIGQYPSFNIEPDTILKKYLSLEDLDNYKKAITCLSVNFGIGAYSYFRRIIENEIKRMIIDISELSFDGVDNVKQALKNYENDHQMGKLIDTLNNFLPYSLKQFGDNPVRLLYEQLSGGIHLFSDTVCIDKARQIDILLKFVIKSINEEKYQHNDIRNAMTKLRNNGS